MDIETILAAGEQHFFAKQYNDVKLDNIANTLGIKKPSLYYYFTNKRAFYIQTLKYSMKKYLGALQETLAGSDSEKFFSRYLSYPSSEHNLFAIATQTGYANDREINSIIEIGRNSANKEISKFLRTLGAPPITIYVVSQLLDKLALENCIDGYCLEYDIPQLTKEIKRIMETQ